MLTHKRIIAALLIDDGGLYKTENFCKPRYIGDPINALRIFNEKEVDEVIILDIGRRAKKDGPNYDLLSEIASELYSPVAYGGGINTFEQAEKILSLGYDKLSFCTALVEKPDVIRRCVKVFGAQSVIACLEIKKNLFNKYKLFYRNGTNKMKFELASYIKYIHSLGVGEIFVNDISRDGTLSGYDIEMHQYISEQATVPVIACGGGNTHANIAKLLQGTTVSAAACGAFFVFQGEYNAILISYPSKEQKLEIINASC